MCREPPVSKAPIKLSKKPLAPRQENSRVVGVHELQKELRNERPRKEKPPPEPAKVYSVKPQNGRQYSDSSNKSNLYVRLKSIKICPKLFSR